MIRVELNELQANLRYYLLEMDAGERIEVMENGVVLHTLATMIGNTGILMPKKADSEYSDRTYFNGYMKLVPDEEANHDQG